MSGIKEIRKMLGLSQHELAEYLSVPRSTLSMAEMNQRMLPAASLLKIADLQLKMNPNRGRRMELLSQAEIKQKTSYLLQQWQRNKTAVTINYSCCRVN